MRAHVYESVVTHVRYEVEEPSHVRYDSVNSHVIQHDEEQ